MAIQATVRTDFGFEHQLYIRLNNVELSKHDGAYALFRGFDSKESFESGSRYLYEKEIKFTPDLNRPIHSQSYEQIKSIIDSAVDV